MAQCETGKWADITPNERTVQIGNTTLRQCGGVNIKCTNHGMSISFTNGGDMQCSGWEKR